MLACVSVSSPDCGICDTEIDFLILRSCFSMANSANSVNRVTCKVRTHEMILVSAKQCSVSSCDSLASWTYFTCMYYTDMKSKNESKQTNLSLKKGQCHSYSTC